MKVSSFFTKNAPKVAGSDKPTNLMQSANSLPSMILTDLTETVIPMPTLQPHTQSNLKALQVHIPSPSEALGCTLIGTDVPIRMSS